MLLCINLPDYYYADLSVICAFWIILPVRLLFFFFNDCVVSKMATTPRRTEDKTCDKDSHDPL